MREQKYYLGYDDDGMGGRKYPCLVRGMVGVDIDKAYAEKLQLREVTKTEWWQIQRTQENGG